MSLASPPRAEISLRLWNSVPDEADVLIAATDDARDLKNLARARKYVERGLELHSGNAVFYRIAAELELADTHLDRAEAVIRRGIEAAPASVPIKILLTETLIDEQKLDGDEGAISWIEQLRRLGLAPGYAQYLEGRVSMVQQRWDEAIKSLENARALLVANSTIIPKLNLMLAECYRRAGYGKDRVIAALQAAASGKAEAKVARTLLAEELERAGRLDEAIAAQLQLMDTRPESRLDLVRLLIVKNSRLPQAQRRWQDARQRLQEASRLLPQATEDLTLLGAELSRAEGKADEAGRMLEISIKAKPKSIRYRIALCSSCCYRITPIRL